MSTLLHSRAQQLGIPLVRVEVVSVPGLISAHNIANRNWPSPQHLFVFVAWPATSFVFSRRFMFGIGQQKLRTFQTKETQHGVIH